MNNELISLLHIGKHSLVVDNGMIYKYDGRGVSDLFRLLQEAPEVLCGASIADKVIGKAAAALMIRGNVKEVYGDTISTSAISLFCKNGVEISFVTEVHHIINQTKSDWCPMEKACYELDSIDEIYNVVQSFYSNK